MYWNWRIGGLALGLIFFAAVALVKPIGVSTQFVILDGIIAKSFSPDIVVQDKASKSGYSSPNPYLNKSGGKYAKSVANPWNYSFIFVLSMIVGGLLGRFFTCPEGENPFGTIPEHHRRRFGETPAFRYLLAFIGGVLVLWGSRMAGGCTSGHMMSGMMQTAISGYLFAFAVFVVAVPVSIILYKKGGKS
jgi:uncharacterized membrane protein YedE/YeeE